MTDAVMQLLEEGYQAMQSGQLKEAEKKFNKVLKRDRDNVHALNLLGMLCVNHARSREAVQYINRALQQSPENPQSLSNLGLAYKDLGEPRKAIGSFRAALKFNPDNPDTLNNLGNVLRLIEEPRKAIEAYEKGLRLQPMFAECWSNLSAALNEADRHERALQAADRAIELDSGLAQAYNNRGDIYLAMARYSDALVEYRQAIGIDPKYAAALINMARTQRDMDSPEEAMRTLQQAIALEPNNPDAILVRGVLKEQQGDRDGAALDFKETIRLLPEMTLAHYYLAQIRGRDVSDEEFAHMQQLEGQSHLSSRARMYLHFALFRACDERSMYAEAYRSLAAGNKIKAEAVPYDDDETEEYLTSIVGQAEQAQNRLPPSSGVSDKRPVFVLGMPRSGTTLTEQILASHSQVAGAGELSFAYDVVHQIRKIVHEKFPDNLALLSAEQFAELGQTYMAKHKEQDLQAARVVDKTPLNFQYIGFLALALPEAKFVHCHRDPVANCFSIHRMPFDDKQAYAHSLTSLGQYYNRYWKLMQEWHRLFPGRILDVRYEDTVADIESQSRAILSFLDLGYEPEVLDFYKTERLVKTPSASQVRQPIYSDAVEAWRVYEPYLEPLIEAIQI